MTRSSPISSTITTRPIEVEYLYFLRLVICRSSAWSPSSSYNVSIIFLVHTVRLVFFFSCHHFLRALYLAAIGTPIPCDAAGKLTTTAPSRV
ncbi:hypothetical protein BHE90_005158 [Fusarium euwallaceae]|uniref:Uncharacterized protein n=2 Tax=Fusarium solani species complex TaxID=232080 RepID=A0A430LX91_9HYPO|nr:hypothetical protein CEP51_003373 [Fusarium floridanum]RTE80357.1 hypothetical protein BHE90_005158 [Fusarium euwallaceae]